MQHRQVISTLAAGVLATLVGAAIAEDGVAKSYELSFASFAPLNSDVFIADADGSNAKPLVVHPDQDYNASFSADGQWVLFTSTRAGSADIYRIHPDGSALEVLVESPAFDDQAALSPDGRWLAFISNRSGQADLWIMELATKQLRNVVSHPEGDFRPSWSHDGQWLAFSSERDSTNPFNTFVPLLSTDIYVVRHDGSGLRRVSHANQFAGSPAWSLDDKRLTFYAAPLTEVSKTLTASRRGIGKFQLTTIDLATNEQRTVTSGDGEKWSPRWLTDERIGYVSRQGIEFVNGTPGARGEFRAPSWTKNSRRVVFDRDTDAQWPPTRPLHSRDPHFKLTRTGIFPSYSSRGDRMVLNDQIAGILKNNLLLAKPDGSSPTIIFSDANASALAPVWSVQGDRIAFALGTFFQMLPTQPRSNADIAIIRPDGKGLQRLTDGANNCAFPTWSPDGREIAYRIYGGDAAGLHIIDVETRRSRPLLLGQHNFPAWSPSADRIAFTSKRDGDYEIYSIDSHGKNLKRLSSSPGNDGHLAWSLDGEWIAFSSDRGGFKDESALHIGNPQSGGDIYVMRRDGSDVRRLTDDQFEEATPGWRPLASMLQSSR